MADILPWLRYVRHMNRQFPTYVAEVIEASDYSPNLIYYSAKL